MVIAVLENGEPLEYLMDRTNDDPMLANDRALARAITATTLRRKGQIDKILTDLMEKPLGKRGGPAMHILRIAAAQILFMEVADHASVSLAMDMAKADHKARHFARLINGVLRTMAREKAALLATLKPRDILPDWIAERWDKSYGAPVCDAMAQALSHEPYLDIQAKSDAAKWVAKLGGTLLCNGTIRLQSRGMIAALPGFEEGAWWVQDMAASLAASLLGDVSGQDVADLCAAPGGKSAYLAARGARVTAVDISNERLKLLDTNLKRLKLEANIVAADIEKWTPEHRFDAVLLDAPCSATGTARKHPDVLWLKNPERVERLATVQRRLLQRVVRFLKPGGMLVFCTCSLQWEEGETILDFVKREKLALEIMPVTPDEIGGLHEIIRADGTIRTRPDHRPQANDHLPLENDPLCAGLDGFFMARFQATG